RVEIEGDIISEFWRVHTREPRVLRDCSELGHVEQRHQVAADQLSPALRHRDVFESYTVGYVSCAVLIKRFRVDAVRVSLHHQWAVGNGGKDVRRDLHVVAKQVAFRQLLARPEDLVKVGYGDAASASPFQHAVASAVFESAKLFEQVIESCAVGLNDV